MKSIIDVSYASFMKNILKLVLLAVPGSFLNSYIEFLRKKLTIEIKNAFTVHYMNKIMQNNNFYKVHVNNYR